MGVVARVATGALLAVPVIFTFVDTVGYVGTVSGGSMQVIISAELSELSVEGDNFQISLCNCAANTKPSWGCLT